MVAKISFSLSLSLSLSLVVVRSRDTVPMRDRCLSGRSSDDIKIVRPAMRLRRDRHYGSLLWFCWYFVVGMVGFVTVSSDGIVFFHAMELQSPVMGNHIGGGESHEVAFSAAKSIKFDDWKVRRRRQLLLGEVRYRVLG
ncbi:hypothetical protein TIFTF001_001647 [Ficus carica]|uniref:Transmembrane protein n=1 Tax=Ficus carica TaxID=3494 RepID=A0AA87Z7M5_FICCA|nr:hypothetical protein TIFTF001_001647 [Ficus carica]